MAITTKTRGDNIIRLGMPDGGSVMYTEIGGYHLYFAGVQSGNNVIDLILVPARDEFEAMLTVKPLNKRVVFVQSLAEIFRKVGKQDGS